MFQSFVKPGAEPGVHPEPEGHQLMCGCGHLEKGLLGSLLVRLVRGGGGRGDFCCCCFSSSQALLNCCL